MHLYGKSDHLTKVQVQLFRTRSCQFLQGVTLVGPDILNHTAEIIAKLKTEPAKDIIIIDSISQFEDEGKA